MPFPTKPTAPSTPTTTIGASSGSISSGPGHSSPPQGQGGVMYPPSYPVDKKKGCGCGCFFSGCLFFLIVLGVAAGIFFWYASSNLEQLLSLVTVEASNDQVASPPSPSLKQIAELGGRLKQFAERGGSLSLTESELNALLVSGQFIKGEQGENPLSQSTVALSDDALLFGLKIPVGPVSGKERILRAVVGIKPRVENGQLKFEFTDVAFKGFKLPQSILDSLSTNGQGIEAISDELLKNIPLEFTSIKIQSKTLILSAKPVS